MRFFLISLLCFASLSYANPAIVAGKHHLCTLVPDGVLCWGDAAWSGHRYLPFAGARALHAGGELTCVNSDEGYRCWGGALGREPISTETLPGLQGFAADWLTVGENTICESNPQKIACAFYIDGKWASKTFEGSAFPQLVAAGDGVVCKAEKNAQVSCYDSSDHHWWLAYGQRHGLFRQLALSGHTVCAAGTLWSDESDYDSSYSRNEEETLSCAELVPQKEARWVYPGYDRQDEKLHEVGLFALQGARVCLAAKYDRLTGHQWSTRNEVNCLDATKTPFSGHSDVDALYTLSLARPDALALSEEMGCTWKGQGETRELFCWNAADGHDRSLDFRIPPFPRGLDFGAGLLKTLSQVASHISAPRATVLRELAERAASRPDADLDFLRHALVPLLDSLDSEFGEEWVRPALHHALGDDRRALASFERNEARRRLALEGVIAAVRALQPSLPEPNDAAEFLRAAGLALSESATVTPALRKAWTKLLPRLDAMQATRAGAGLVPFTETLGEFLELGS